MATQKGRNWSSGDIVTAANLSSVERGVSAVSSLYEPTTWANGDTVTAAALNNIEQGIVNADDGGKTWVTLCEEEVTTEENNGLYMTFLSYSQLISADTIRVTFDGNEYMCESVSPMEGTYIYGGSTPAGPDFSEYPFAIVSGITSNEEVVNQIMTETSDTYTIKIEALQESGSSDFSTAQVTVDFTNLSNEAYTFNLDMPTIVNSPVGNIIVGHVGESNLTGPINTFNAVLNTNGCGAVLDTSGVSVSVSGSISQIGESGETTNYLIIGDCAITISNLPTGR